MNSPKKLNYETRPHKFAERKMLLASLLKLCNYFGKSYQYIGFGGLAFTDFKLFHKELHIEELFSIEGGSFSLERVSFNSPYPFITIKQSNSSKALTEIDLTKKSLVWLDYEDALENFMFDDIALLFGKLPLGSIYLVSCNRELKMKKTGVEYLKEEFKDKFGNIVPFNIENSDFSSLNNSITISRMFNKHIDSIIEERNSIEDSNLKFHQLYNLLYEEYRGARMYTFGGVIAEESFNKHVAGLEIFDFINNPFQIEIPNLTRKEIDLLDSHLFEREEELLSLKIITEKELNQYKIIYKYIPHFYDIRL